MTQPDADGERRDRDSDVTTDVAFEDGAHEGLTRRVATSGVQTLDRAAAIFNAFSSRQPALGVTEISARTGLSTSTSFRLLNSLQHNGLLRQTADRRYVLGPVFLQLAHLAATHAVLREVALPTMIALRDRGEETVGLHELSGTSDRVTILQAESRLALRRTYTDLGRPIPLPQGAPGKALLAFLPQWRQEAVLTGPLETVTPTTITDVTVLRQQLVETRRVGFAISLGERTLGISSVAAPIWDQTGHPVACLSISAPDLRMKMARCKELGEMVKVSAWEVSELLGASPVVVAETKRHAAKSDH